VLIEYMEKDMKPSAGIGANNFTNLLLLSVVITLLITSCNNSYPAVVRNLTPTINAAPTSTPTMIPTSLPTPLPKLFTTANLILLAQFYGDDIWIGSKLTYWDNGKFCYRETFDNESCTSNISVKNRNSLVWSPDGKKIAFDRYLGHNEMGICVYDTKRQRIRPCIAPTQTDNNRTLLQWDERGVWYFSDQTYLWDPETMDLTTLSSYEGDSETRKANNGRYITEVQVGNFFEEYVHEADGTELMRFTNAALMLSPDGRYVVYSQYPHVSRIWENIDTHVSGSITDSESDIIDLPIWSPDSRFLMAYDASSYVVDQQFYEKDAKQIELYIIDVYTNHIYTIPFSKLDCCSKDLSFMWWNELIVVYNTVGISVYQFNP
jgi:hypothetical protein